MNFHDKKEIGTYIGCCVFWSVITICIQYKMGIAESINDFCLYYWRGFESIGTSLLWWIVVQLPVYGGIIFRLKNWKQFAVYIYLKKGVLATSCFFAKKVIGMAGTYYGVHLIVILLLLKFVFNNMQSTDVIVLFAGMPIPSNIFIVYILEFLNGILFAMAVLMLYVFSKNEYLSFLGVLCIHIIVNILGVIGGLPTAYMWTMSGNVLAWTQELNEWNYVAGSVLWIIIQIVLLYICLRKRKEYFFG